MKHFLHCSVVHGSNNNSGDNILYEMVRSVISKNFSLPINWLTLSQWEANSAALLNSFKSDLIVFGGGGLFLPDQKGSTTKNKSYWQIDLSSSDHVNIIPPYIACSIGFNWFRYSMYDQNLIKENARSFIANSLYFSCRNYGSINRLQSITELPETYFHWLPCPTTLIDLYIDPLDIPINRKIIPKKVCAINLPGDRLEQRLFNHTSYSHIKHILNTVRENDYKLVYLAHKDIDLNSLHDFPDNYFDGIVNISHYSYEEVIKFYRSLDLVLGGRGHSLMIPVGLNVPIISLTTHDKQKFFMQDLCLEPFSLEIDSKDYQMISSKLHYCMANIALCNDKFSLYKRKANDAWLNLASHLLNNIYG